MKRLTTILAAACLAVAPLHAGAQPVQSRPEWSQIQTGAPPARDAPYPGVMTLSVDARDVTQKIWRIRQTIPVASAGEIALYYPQWIPGNHAPRGPIYNVAGLRVRADGRDVRWRRDSADVHLFWVDVPAGAGAIDLSFDYLNPTDASHGGAQVTQEMLRLNWYAVSFYPAGHYARGVQVEADLRLPAGWKAGTALDRTTTRGDTVRFARTSYETLVDSPVFAGLHFRQVDLDPGSAAPVRLNIVADSPALFEIREDVLQIHRNLVVQTDRLFGGARHFDHYDFLLAISDRLAGSGIEHARSSDNGVRSGYFRDWDTDRVSRDLLAHEYVHSWNGKFRRPADLWTPHYNTPMRNSLLWVYEGLTQYYGAVLAARAGFLTQSETMDALAQTAAVYDARDGRNWRPLADTTMDPVIAARRPIPWRSWQRSEDYYSEGLLIWLDADTLIREKTQGGRSLDDFAREFFGFGHGDWGQVLYTRENVVAALNRIAPHDWDGFFRERVDDVTPDAPLDGVVRGGYRLVYAPEPNPSQKASEARRRTADLTWSIGLTADASGRIGSVRWDSAAFRAGLSEGVVIIAVNGEAFDLDRLRSAVAATARGDRASFLYRVGDAYRTVVLDYTGGHRYPTLKAKGDQRSLDAIHAPR